MNSLRNFLAVSTVLAVAGLGAAHAGTIPAGTYALSLGHAAPCNVTLAADGTADASACTEVKDVTRWHQRGSNLELSSGGGTVYSVLHAKGDGFAGSTFAKNTSLTLMPTSTAQLAH